MAKVERIREALRTPPNPDYLKRKGEAGWRLVALEWERDAGAEEKPRKLTEEVPFGLRVADDCLHLEENPSEKQALLLMMELIVQDLAFSRIADELNRKGFRTRLGLEWDQVSVFNLLPRLIEVGPQIFTSEEWVERKQCLFKLA